MGATDWPKLSGIGSSLTRIFLDCRTSCNRSPPAPDQGRSITPKAPSWYFVWRCAIAIGGCGLRGNPCLRGRETGPLQER